MPTNGWQMVKTKFLYYGLDLRTEEGRRYKPYKKSLSAQDAKAGGLQV